MNKGQYPGEKRDEHPFKNDEQPDGHNVLVSLAPCSNTTMSPLPEPESETKSSEPGANAGNLEEQYRILAETLADCVLTIDPLGKITYVNPSFEHLTGRPKEEIVNSLFREYLTDDSVYLFQQTTIDVRTHDKIIKNVELELLNSKNIMIPIEVNFAPLKKDDVFRGIVCTIRDISDHKNIESELKKSEKLKTEFMNIAAHELKSPVTPIKGYLDLIIHDDSTCEQVKKWAKISLRNADRLLLLVNDILDVARLDSDTMRFDIEKVDPMELLTEIAEDMRPAVEQKHLELLLHLPQELPPIMGDRHRLSQVFKNLLVNAVKFTDEGHIAIKAKQEGKYILIEVEDTGIGIATNDQQRIFSKFYQAYTADDRRHEGTGLGLFICKQIIQKHNGTIWVKSTLRKGSTFYLKLPHL
jgi:two-component system phosphate regulon sensor histidine kinase PhoR